MDDVEWDARKAVLNLRKHGVDFADAALALMDENALTIIDHDTNELRFKTLCMDPSLKVLYVIHCEGRKKAVRIISARKATKHEVKQYYQGLK